MRSILSLKSGAGLIVFINPNSFLNILFDQTTIASFSQVAGTFTKSASPFYVKGNIFIPKDSTLIIEPGFQIRFDRKYYYSKHIQGNFN